MNTVPAMKCELVEKWEGNSVYFNVQVRFEVLTAVKMSVLAFWVVMPWRQYVPLKC
jgi:hypothetical protein